jgi:hypothetical protein
MSSTSSARLIAVIFYRQREGSQRRQSPPLGHFSSTIGPLHDRPMNSTDDQAAPLCPTIQSQPALPARRVASGVVAVVDTWRLSQSRKFSSTIANSEPLIGSMWSSLMTRSSPDLSASRTTAAALPLLALRRWRTSAMASPNDSNRVLPVLLLTECTRRSGMVFLRH